MATKAEIREAFGLESTADGFLYVDPDDALADPQLRGQAHYMRRAFDRLRLDAILCIDGVPTIYLKEYRRPVRREEANQLHQGFWNEGTGTLLIILDPECLYVFSSMSLPSDDDGEIASHQGLVEALEPVANALQHYNLITRIASGQYYRQHADKFRPDETVDRYLLNQLAAVGESLRRNDSVEERKRVHAFLGRIIFTCYLIDRGIIDLAKYPFIRKKKVKKLSDLFAAYEAEQAKGLLYQIFDNLRHDFNGSMFDEELDEEKRTISENDMRTLSRFLSGHEVKGRQKRLGFWAYDFSVIPVETVSAIYERFLEEEDASEKDRQGAFYTPKHLAEMVVNEATSGFDSLIDKRCLDPACGSGIFLVIFFNRIAEEILRRNPRSHSKTRFNELLKVLETQICGVDVNLTACRIACFSLYIALLDQFEPRELSGLEAKSGKRLPNLLAYKHKNHTNASTIYEGNYFDPRLPIRDDFDIVVGNPPWVGRNQTADPDIFEWTADERNNPFLESAPVAKAERTAIFLPQKQIAHAFMWKTALSTNENGHICLLLPVQVLLNETDAFQHAWFASMDVRRVFNLSDFRLFLFQDAKRPATIIHFAYPKSEERDRRIEHIAPKVRRQDPRSGLIKVFPEDRKWVSVSDVLQASHSDENSRSNRVRSAAVFWKALLWGTARDIDFVEFLSGLDCLGDIAGEPNEGKRWIKGEGFQPWYQISYDTLEDYPEPKPIPGTLNDRFISTVDDAIGSFILLDDTISLKERLESISHSGCPASTKGFRRSPDKRIFTPPLVVVNKGFTKFAFTDFRVLFQHSLRGISGPTSDSNLLRFLVVYLRSRLAQYFAFHTSGSWGTEREEVRVHELMRLPFPLPGSSDSHKEAEEIVSEVAAQMKRLQSEIEAEFRKLKNTNDFKLQRESLAVSRRQKVEQLQSELEPLIFKYFNLTDSEIILIEDTCNVLSDSATPSRPDKSIPATQSTSTDDRFKYAEVLCKTLNQWAKQDQQAGVKPPFYFSADVSEFSETEMVLVTLHQTDKPQSPREVKATNQLQQVLARIASEANYASCSFEYLRGVIIADRRKIHILKPDMLAQWTRTAALNDADRVFHAIVQSKRK